MGWTGSQAMAAELAQSLPHVRWALQDLRVETQRTAAEHERMAAWYGEHGDEPAARMERHSVQAIRGLEELVDDRRVDEAADGGVGGGEGQAQDVDEGQEQPAVGGGPWVLAELKEDPGPQRATDTNVTHLLIWPCRNC